MFSGYPLIEIEVGFIQNCIFVYFVVSLMNYDYKDLMSRLVYGSDIVVVYCVNFLHHFAHHVNQKHVHNSITLGEQILAISTAYICLSWYKRQYTDWFKGR